MDQTKSIEDPDRRLISANLAIPLTTRSHLDRVSANNDHDPSESGPIVVLACKAVRPCWWPVYIHRKIPIGIHLWGMVKCGPVVESLDCSNRAETKESGRRPNLFGTFRAVLQEDDQIGEWFRKYNSVSINCMGQIYLGRQKKSCRFVGYFSLFRSAHFAICDNIFD